MTMSGGCQCGAVRFRVDNDTRRGGVVCYCRMCQKAFGAPFGAFVNIPVAELTWTRGQIKTFRSSDAYARGFCGDCGTTLTFEAGGGRIGLTIAAFDDPAGFAPTLQLDLPARLPWLEGLNALPTMTPAQEAAARAPHGPPISRQHPDHDTDVGPPVSIDPR